MDNIKCKKIIEYSCMELAFLGDAIWEVEVRKYFLTFGYNINKLNQLVRNFVNAKSQSKFLKEIFINTTDEEKKFIKRAKNSNIKTFPRTCSSLEYREATAFEAYIAKLYLENNEEKIKDILFKFVKSEVNGDGK